MSLLLALQGGGTTHNGAVAFDGVGALTLAAVNENRASVAFSGVGVIIATAVNENRASVAFDGAGNITALAVNENRASVSFDGVGDLLLTADVVLAEGAEPDTHDGFGGHRRRRERAFVMDFRRFDQVRDRGVREQLEAAFNVFERAPEQVQEQVREIVRPYAVSTTPRTLMIDTKPLARSVASINALMNLYLEELARRREQDRDEDDVETLLLYH